MRNSNLTTQVNNILKMAKHESDAEKRVQLVKRNFLAAYPKLEDKPEMVLMLEQLINLYRDAEIDIRPMCEQLRLVDPRQYTILYKTYLNVVHEIGSLLVKMGFTYCSQKAVPVEERKSADPKAVMAVNRQINALKTKIAKAKKDLPMPPTNTEPLPIETSKSEGDQ